MNYNSVPSSALKPELRLLEDTLEMLQLMFTISDGTAPDAYYTPLDIKVGEFTLTTLRNLINKYQISREEYNLIKVRHEWLDLYYDDLLG